MEADNIDLNRASFRDCFSSALLERLSLRPRTTTKRRPARSKKNLGSYVKEEDPHLADADDLADFIEYLTSEIFAVLPAELRSLSYSQVLKDPRLGDKYSPDAPSDAFEDIRLRVPHEVVESLSTYDILPPSTSFPSLFDSALAKYVATAVAPPPLWINTRTAACEICERDWVRLTYHHLIPKQVHDKVRKRKWHEEWRLNSVAWLCRACHDFVHRIASNEELARHLWTVDLLLEREDVQAWAAWVGRIRWKAR